MMYIDYKISGKYDNTTIDLRSATIEQLHYELFTGDIILKDKDTDFSTSWEWVPLLDFTICIKNILASLHDGKTEIFNFTESDAELLFTRNDEILGIRASYAEGCINVDLWDLRAMVNELHAKLLQDLSQKHAMLKENLVFQEL